MKVNQAFVLLLRYAKGHKRRIALLTFVSLGSTMLYILAPRVLSRFIDSVYAGAALHTVLFIVLMYLAAVLARIILSALLNIQLTDVGQRITDDHRRDVMAHFLALDAQTLGGYTSGEVVTRLDEDVEGLFRYYYVLIYKLAGSGLVLAGILMTLALESGWLCAVLFLVSLLAILGFRAIQQRGIPKYVRRSAAAASFNGTMKEMLDNAVTLRALHAEGFAQQRVKPAMYSRFRESFPASLMYGNLWSASTMMQGIVVASGLLFALLLWDAGAITLGMAYLIYTYSELIIEPLQDFRNHMGRMQDARAGILRTQELLSLPVMARSGMQVLPEGPLSLEIDGLRFAYANGGDVLRGISLSLPAGARLGIMGESGCGKSTLMSIIARLNDYDRGSVRISGMELRDISPDSLRERVAYCTQRVYMIHGNLRDNIAFFDSHFSDADIMAAIQSLGLSGWFAKFPKVLDTPLDMGEGNLSSGEAQLISLIRLALRAPGLVLLDEITARLDAATERRVIHAVRALCKGRTVIAIAHSGEALPWMNGIVHMENGAFARGGK